MDSSQETGRGLAAAAGGLGYFSLLLSWWFPFGLLLGCVGVLLGVISIVLLFRDRGRPRRAAVFGIVLPAVGASLCAALGWGTYLRVFGM